MASKTSKRRRVYYAHAICTYGKPDERRDLKRIRSKLSEISIVNPARGHPLKLADTMGFCLKLVEDCDIVVFTRLMGKVTSGVGKEVNHALGLGTPVFELSDVGFLPRTRKVVYISRRATVNLYEKYLRSLVSGKIKELQQQLSMLRKRAR